MRAMAINGSPRKKWNTAQLLDHALAGAAQAGAETEMVHLYDLDYKGCISCFSCKKVGGPSYGRCAVQDDLAPVLERALGSDVLILGSPVYYYSQSGEMRSFLERLLFPLTTYTREMTSLNPGRARIGLVHTMNIPAEMIPEMGLDKALENTVMFMNRIFGNCASLVCTDTLQFDDYSKYLCTRFDPEAKKKRREEVFPKDLEAAFAMGGKLAQEAAV